MILGQRRNDENQIECRTYGQTPGNFERFEENFKGIFHGFEENLI
jgi:hypothetical protein